MAENNSSNSNNIYYATYNKTGTGFENYVNEVIHDAIISASQPCDSSVMFTDSFNEEDFNRVVNAIAKQKPYWHAATQEPIWITSGWNNRPLKIRFEEVEPIKYNFYDTFDSVVLTPEEFETKYTPSHPEDDCEEYVDEFPELDEYIKSLGKNVDED